VTLVAQIEGAFSVAPVPEEPLLEPVYLDPARQGDEGATEYFSGKPWNILDVEMLRYHSIALYMFTPEAHRYYLPAFMIASLQHPREADVIPLNSLSHLSQYKEPYWWERARALSPSQCAVVSDFVRAVAEEHTDPGMVSAALAGLAQAAQTPNKSLERTREG
jgi:hypothetical protein